MAALPPARQGQWPLAGWQLTSFPASVNTRSPSARWHCSQSLVQWGSCCVPGCPLGDQGVKLHNTEIRGWEAQYLGAMATGAIPASTPWCLDACVLPAGKLYRAKASASTHRQYPRRESSPRRSFPSAVQFCAPSGRHLLCHIVCVPTSGSYSYGPTLTASFFVKLVPQMLFCMEFYA